MQEMDKIKKHNKIITLLLILCLVVIVVLAGMLLLTDWDLPKTEEIHITGDIAYIETPYCTLEYPAEMADALKCVGEKEDGTYSKVFYGCIDDKEYELFEISFGAKPDATLIGYIAQKGIKYPVFVRSKEIDEMTDKNLQNKIFTMQEGINNVIQSIITNEKYSKE